MHCYVLVQQLRVWRLALNECMGKVIGFEAQIKAENAKGAPEIESQLLCIYTVHNYRVTVTLNSQHGSPS